MIEFNLNSDIPKDFTGICKILFDSSIRYYQNGLPHREDGPAVIYEIGCKAWYINGLYHREDGPAIEYPDGENDWYYKNKCYGVNSNFTIDSWKEKVEYLKREEELKVFV